MTAPKTIGIRVCKELNPTANPNGKAVGACPRWVIAYALCEMIGSIVPAHVAIGAELKRLFDGGQSLSKYAADNAAIIYGYMPTGWIGSFNHHTFGLHR